MNAEEVFRHEAPVLRAKLIEVAAALDRIDRAGGAEFLRDDSEPIRALRELLDAEGGDRAERIQTLYSRAYDAEWRARFAAREGAG